MTEPHVEQAWAVLFTGTDPPRFFSMHRVRISGNRADARDLARFFNTNWPLDKARPVHVEIRVIE